MTDTTSDPYAEIASLESTALNDFQAKLTQFQADLTSIFAAINPAGVSINTPARTFYGRTAGSVSMMVMDLTTTLSGYSTPTATS